MYFNARNTCLVMTAVTLFISSAICKKIKRAAFDLPDGLNILKSPLKRTFTCNSTGYFADVDNWCQVFHVCLAAGKEEGSRKFHQWSFLCSPGTYFNQLTMTCDQPLGYFDVRRLAIPCESSPQFYYLNDKVYNGDKNTKFLSIEDINKPYTRGFTYGRVGHLQYVVPDKR